MDSSSPWLLALLLPRLRLLKRLLAAITILLFLLLFWKITLEKAPYPSKAKLLKRQHNNLNAAQDITNSDQRKKLHPLNSSDIHNDSLFYLPYSEDIMSDDLTVISAFFDLGRFRKGDSETFFSPNLYRTWMRSFAQLQNPVVMYVESEADGNYFKSLRNQLASNLTLVQKVSREDLWAFRLQGKIQAIFSRPGYPKFHPNTVLPEYSCAMQAKYELMRTAILSNFFGTKYFCWLDVGLFRDMTGGGVPPKPFQLWLPPQFDINRVAYTQVEDFIQGPALPIEAILTGDIVWVCGCFFVARAAVMIRWVQDYMKAVERYVDMRLMDTDQQVLYCMVKEKLNKIQVQTYKPDGRYNNWFHLAYVCKEAGQKKLITGTSIVN